LESELVWELASVSVSESESRLAWVLDWEGESALALALPSESGLVSEWE
jgi:hypothetical protein